MEGKDPVPSFMRPTKWTLLLVGDNHGCVGPYGSKWESHPAHYERVDVCEVSATNAAAAGEPATPREMAIAQAVRHACVECYGPDDTATDYTEKMGDLSLSSIIATIPPLTAPAPQTDEIPAILFDGYAVYNEVMANDPHTPRPTADNIADVLDAVVRLLRRAAPPRSPEVRDPIRDLIAEHAELLEANAYTYFELAYTRRTEWMAWLCSNHREADPDRKVLANGQGNTPEEACANALKYLRTAASNTESGGAQ
jgi:hypothetical protein